MNKNKPQPQWVRMMQTAMQTPKPKRVPEQPPAKADTWPPVGATPTITKE